MQNNYSIFYTDDDHDDQQLFRDAISRIDSTVDVHLQSDGVELMEKLENPPPRPKLLFLDLNMPRKNGFQVLEEMKESKKHEDVTIIVFTTSDDKENIARTKDLGASAFITKPQQYPNFLKAIKHCLSMDWANFKSAAHPFVLSFN